MTRIQKAGWDQRAKKVFPMDTERELNIAGCGKTSGAFFQIECVGKIGWQPIFCHPTCDGRKCEVNDQNPESGLGPESQKSFPDGHGARVEYSRLRKDQRGLLSN